jgi:LTXXQ motif family protein
MTIRTLAVVAASLAAGALCLWTNAAAARGGGHFGGGHFGGMHFGGGHFGGMRFGGGHFGGMRFGGGHFGGMRFGGGHFGGMRFGGPRFGGPRFGGVQSRGRMGSRLANRPFARPALRNTALARRPFAGGRTTGNRMGVGRGVRAATAGAAAGRALQGRAGAAGVHAFNAQGGQSIHQGGFRHNAFANKGAWNNWAFKRHGCCVWFGNIFWPFVAGDVFSAVFWQSPWYGPFWGYGDDYLLSNVLWVGSGAGAPSYTSTNLYDIYGARRGSAVGSGGGRPSKQAEAGEVDAESAQACGDLAPGVTDFPINDIERTVSPTGEQRAALDAVKAAWPKAMKIIKASCAGEVPLTPVRRLDVAEERLGAVMQGLAIVRDPLESFYSSLSEGQRRSFDTMTIAARDRSEHGAGLAGRLPSLCSERAASFSQLPLERIEELIRPSGQQREALNALKAASAQASEGLKAFCPTETPQGLPDRLRAVEARLGAMIVAVRSVRPALTDFYALLSDEQKARFNMMGQTQIEGNAGRARRQAGTP